MAKADKRDFNYLADFVTEEWRRRKDNRKDLERQWKDIDRQVDMEPDANFKLGANGRPDPNMAWMPELELPDQAEALEVLTADSRRMMFPDSGPWYRAHSLMSDEYLARVDYGSIIAGDENDVPSIINQDNADKLVHGVIDHWHRKYSFADHLDMINAEAFKYSLGIGRGRMVTAPVFWHESRGVVQERQRIPMLFPLSVKNVFVEDREHYLMNEGMAIRPAHILWKSIHIEDLKAAANAGSSDPNKEDGGWMPANLKGLEGNKTHHVDLLEWEGDLIAPRKTTGSLFLPNCLATIAVDGGETRLIRLRFRTEKGSSFILHHYHREHIDRPYGTSPLMKGHHIQKAAVDALTRLMMVAAVNAQPPLKYNKDDPYFAATGGPRVFPGALWGSAEGVDVENNIGDLQGMLAVYAGLLQQYADVVGVNAPRLGAQTLSHTTAFAKDAELTRGTVRTVNYVKRVLAGPMTRWLDMAYRMGRANMKGKQEIYIEAYGGWVNVGKDALPDEVVFDVHGAGGPAEEQQKNSMRMSGLQFAFSADQLKAQYEQMGITPTIDMESAIEQVLRESGWTDTDALLSGATQAAEPGPGLESDAGGTGLSPGAALQGITLQGR